LHVSVHCAKFGVLHPASCSIQHGAFCGIFEAPLFVLRVIPLSKSPEPLFREIYRRLKEAILSGVFREGEKLPSTRVLAEQFGISRTVVLVTYVSAVSHLMRGCHARVVVFANLPEGRILCGRQFDARKCNW